MFLHVNHPCHAGKRFCDAQMCFAPPVADLNDAAKSGVTSPDTVYLYTALFNSLVDPCNGELVHFDVCYQFTDSQDPQQAPAVVFQLLILEDRGSEYSVVAAVEEREDRDCFVESQCCKSLELSYSVQLQANYSLAIIIPATPGGNLFSLSTTSLGNVANTRGQQRLPTTRGSLIFKSQLWLSNTEGPVFITDKSVRVVIGKRSTTCSDLLCHHFPTSRPRSTNEYSSPYSHKCMYSVLYGTKRCLIDSYPFRFHFCLVRVQLPH